MRPMKPTLPVRSDIASVILSLLVGIVLLTLGLPDRALAQSIPDRGNDRWGAATPVPGPTPTDDPRASAIAPNGDVFILYRGTDGLRLGRWDGTDWIELDGVLKGATPGAALAQAVAVGADGTVYVAGRFNVVEREGGTIAATNIARWSPGDEQWSAVGGGLDSYVNDVAVDAEGRVVAGGIFINGFNGGSPVVLNGVGRWDPSTDAWEPFGEGLVGIMASFPPQAYTIDVQGDDIVVAGEFEEVLNPGGAPMLVNNVARWDDAAQSWQPLGRGLENDVPVLPRPRDLVFAGDGSIYLAGDATAGTQSTVPLEALNPDGTSVSGYVLRWSGGTWAPFGADLDVDVMGDLVQDGTGRFYARHTVAQTSTISERVGGTWTTIATFPAFQFANTIAANVFSTQSDVYAGGRFSGITDPAASASTPRPAFTVQATNHARWNGVGWQALTSSSTPPSGTNGDVRAIAHQRSPGSAVAIGGTFSAVGSSPAEKIAIRRDDNQSWEPVGGGVTSAGASVRALTFSPDGTRLYAGGDFTEVTQPSGALLPVSHFAMYDRETDAWTPLGASFDGPVYALHVVEDRFRASNVLYVGGAFTEVSLANGTVLPAPGLVRYRVSSNAWEAVGGVSGAGAVVYALASGDALPGQNPGTTPEVHDLFVGGSFASAVDGNGTVVPDTPNIARYDAWRNTWHAVGRGANDVVRALAYVRSQTPPNRGPTQPQGVLYAGGDFTNVRDGTGANTVVNHLAKWTTDTDAWGVLGFNNAENGVNAPVRALYVHPGLTDRTYFVGHVGLIVGGEFTEATSSNRRRVSANRLALLVDEGASFAETIIPYEERFLPFGTGLDGPVDAIAMRECDLRVANRETLYAGGRFGAAGGRSRASIALWQLQWGGYGPGVVIRSSGNASSGGGRARGGAVRSVPQCGDLLGQAMGPSGDLFSGLLPGASAPLPEGLPSDAPFSLEITDADTGTPIATLDSIVVETVLPTALVLMGLPDTTGFAPNPEGVPIAVTAQPFTLPPPDPTGSNVRLMVVHTATDAPSVSLRDPQGAVLAEEVRYGTAQRLTAPMPPGLQTIEVRQSDDGSLLGTFTGDVGKGGEVAMLVLQGFLDPSANQNGPPLDLAVVTETPPVLPVELTSFTATLDGPAADPVVLLQWKTAAETNNAGFVVQHRTTGSDVPRWTDAGFVDGVGTTDRPQTYTHRVFGLAPGRYAFRLRQVDLDGTSTFGPEVAVMVDAPAGATLSEVAPNPVRVAAEVTLTVSEAQRVRAEMYDVLGRRVGVLFEGRVPAHVPQRWTVDGRQLASGVYFVRVEGETFRETRRLVRIR